MSNREEQLQYEYSSSISGDSDVESCSSDSEDDATSNRNQPSDSGKLDASGPIYDFSVLMAQLPDSNKRGLSKYYDGKSQSFTSLFDVKCVEDLPKKQSPYKRRIKPSKSYADGLSDKDQEAVCNYNPNNNGIAKNSSRGSCGNLLARNINNGRSSLSCRPPPIPLNKNSSRLS
ncbi:hypothetical protein LUZ62_048710 [Rhynchospora pubera]|uniref:Uncharacterized protein n=1 Tax=Rhynchospora pubera TaxID=906938 RepID=A0AAV8C296_9POAL|nr:hypothetical protein LUZ62_012177 [Rhynchospora pubera]KAJ4749630.1 hypothetical protein LUZ62_084035 [Rhynchospora pubera]KAJ4797464.1 hypothetical protein LUZ62_048710 [Rhynchospora pubera]